MSLELEQDDLQLDQEVEQPELPIEEAEVEQEKRGYLTYDEYVNTGGDPEAYQGPKAYDNYGKLIKEVKQLQKEVRSKNTTLETMVDLYKKEEERIADKYRNYYQQQQRILAEAEQVGDIPAVREASQALVRTEQQYTAETQHNKMAQQQQLVSLFEQRNQDWYNTQNPDLVDTAKRLAIQYEREYPHLAMNDPAYLLQKVEDEMRGRYVHAQDLHVSRKETLSATPNYTIPPSQGVVNRTGVGKTKISSLTKEQQEEYRMTSQFYKNTGIDYTIDDYIKFNERNKV